ncbi:hypothetical protein [Cohnella sp. REN36]|uniref:COG4705 family protein n=1 Tax=Cohnella sp. REN36 TaxID=2887347 RepID=UPI001D14F44D|nr:hypothetical protein [Cohnella sp. REN36]MCC3371500.1 hypothetical protein [Cohnella sp. REN36]
MNKLPAAEWMNKVPEVTLYFWIIKIMATTIGETAADYLNFHLGWGLANTTWFMLALFLVGLIAQLRSKTYIPGIYWLVVVLISVVGTLITDNLTDNVGVPLEATTILFAIALAAAFTIWYRAERTLSIHTIYSGRREYFYWLVILITFALGTSAGDLLSEGLDLGYAWSAVLFTAAIALVTFAYFRLRLNAVTAFWIAYVLTRPFGASVGDYLTQSWDDGGLGLGSAPVTILFLITIVGLVAYLSVSKRDRIHTPET